MNYKLLEGVHSHEGKLYRAGDIIRTTSDLVAIFGADKFENISCKRGRSVKRTDHRAAADMRKHKAREEAKKRAEKALK